MNIYNIKSVSQASGKQVQRFWKKLFKNKNFIITWTFRLFALGVAGLALLFVYYSFTLPDPNTLLQRTVAESTKIYDRNGELLYEIHGEAKRTLVPLDQINDYLKHATVAVEDKDFYKHNGVSFRGLIRAVLIDLASGQKQQGGSTITQQFVKNALLTKDKSITRKIKELVLSVELEARYSKDQILQLYLNEIPYGRNAYGIEAASRAYFNKSAHDLTLAESAYLAALPQSTTYYNPFGPHREALNSRQQTILGLMQAQGYISKTELEQAEGEKVTFIPLQNSLRAPHFVLYVQDYLAEKYGERTLEEGGYKVYTTLDSKLQAIAENAVTTQAEKNAKNNNGNNDALVAIDPKTGQILAMVGSKDFFGESYPTGCNPGKDCLFDPSVNVAIVNRQPGSSIKPFVYLTAFKKEFGFSPASLLMDVTTNFGKNGNTDYIPQNYKGNNNGPVSMRKALAGSLNIPAVKTLALVGVNNATATAHDLGITSPLENCGLSLVLGGCEVKLLDHTNAYATLANGGIKHNTTPILKVQDKNGNTLEEYQDQGLRVADEQAVYEITNILSDDSARSYIFGAGSQLTLPGRPLACKTGTTNKWKDGWSMCYTPSIAVGVWVGNSNSKEMKTSADGSRVAAPISNQFLREALKDIPVEHFDSPPGITTVTVDAVSGLLPTDYTPQTKEEIFASYAVPTTYDNVHVVAKLDKTTGLPANNLTPPENLELRPYLVFKSERPDNPAWEEPVRKWMIDQNLPIPPTGVEIIAPGNSNGPALTISEPQANSIITQLPLTVSIDTKESLTKLDVLVDGQLVESKTSAPFTFQIYKQLSDGPRMIAIHAVSLNGRTTDLSVPVTLAVNAPLTIMSPTKNNITINPVTLKAISGNNLGTVTFYVNDAIVGTSQANLSNGSYIYELTFDAPKPGTYKLFAKAGNTQTPKETFTVVDQAQ